MFLLDVMPEKERQNITVIKLLSTCAGIRRGASIPDEQENDTGSRDIPSAAYL